MKKNQMNQNLVVLMLLLLITFTYSATIGVRYIKCSKSNEYMNLAQIEAYRTNGDNVALGKPVTQSSYHGTYAANNIVDGIGDSFSHTLKEKQNWMLIDLQMDYTDLWRLKIINRRDCCLSRASGMKCEFLDSKKKSIESFTLSGGNYVYDFTTKFGKEWETEGSKCNHFNYVKTIRILSDTSRREYLNLGEVQVFNKKDENIALKRKVTSSSIYSSSYQPHQLTDGNINSFAHTKNYLNEWFRVHLDHSFNEIRKIVIYNRRDCCKSRANGISVILEDEYGNGLERVILHGTKDVYEITPKCQNIGYKKKKLIK